VTGTVAKPREIHLAPCADAAGAALRRFAMPIRNWGSAMHQFAVIYRDRVPL